MSEFLRQFLGQPIPREDKRSLADALTYHVATEGFDRTLDGFWHRHDHDTWIPYDRAISQRHAAVLLERFRACYRVNGFPWRAFLDALRRYACMGHEDMKRNLKVLRGQGIRSSIE